MELVIFTGLPASGKSTFCRERFAATHEHVSKDRFRNNKNPDRRQRRLIEEALAARRSVVVDNTNPTCEERRSLVELGHEHGAKVAGYYFGAEPRECIERNRERRDKARVPNVAIYAAAKKLVPPARSEGFDELHCVLIAGEWGGFEVRGWSGDSEVS